MISILAPTRKRPIRLKQMIDSAVQTAIHKPEILCYVSDDDDSYDGGGFYPARIIKGPRLLLSDLWNALIPHATGDIFMQCADDVLFRTKGWDLEVERAFSEYPDHIVLVFCNDLSFHGGEFATLPFVHRRWVETVGYFTGPGFSSWYSDTWPNEVADMIARKKYLPNVEIEHIHPSMKKATIDATYREGAALRKKEDLKKLYADRFPERMADAAKLREAMRCCGAGCYYDVSPHFCSKPLNHEGPHDTIEDRRAMDALSQPRNKTS